MTGYESKRAMARDKLDGMEREASKLALEVLEQLQGGCTDHDDGTVEAITVWCPEVIDAIKEALAQQAQEPVALPDLPLTPYRRIDDAPLWDKHHLHSYALRYADLLTTPPAAQPAQEPVAHMEAIDQLKSVLCDPEGKCCIAGSDEDRAIVDRALVALAQPAQEPVAWMQSDEVHISLWKDDYHTIPLYTTPPQRTWVGLTDKEAQWLYDNCRTPSNLIDMVEAKLKEKNNG